MSRIKYPYEFDPQKRRIAKSYRRGRMIILFMGLLISLATVLIILFSSLHIAIRNFVVQYPASTLFYGFLTLLIFSVTGFPLTFFSTFVYEKMFKLSRYSFAGWFKDYLKSDLISYTFSLILIVALYFAIRTFSLWWVFAGLFYIIFSAIVSYVYPQIIVPFMWKTEPYRDKSMKNKILDLCKKLGVSGVRNIVVIKESEKSIRPNAFFIGFGNSKRMGLFDTLLNSFPKNEIESVVGHELAHYVNKDVLRGLILDSILIFPTLFAVDYFVGLFGPTFGVQAIGDIASLPLFGLIYGVIGFLLMPLTNTHSRWREAQADEFALRHIRKAEAQVSLEKRLADLHLSELKAHPLIEFWLYTHPSTFRRIKMAEEYKKKSKR